MQHSQRWVHVEDIEYIRFVGKNEKKITNFHSLAARAQEEAFATPTKLTNQLYVRSAAANNNNAINGADESLNAATFVSVVSVTATAIPHVIRLMARSFIIIYANCSVIVCSPFPPLSPSFLFCFVFAFFCYLCPSFVILFCLPCVIITINRQKSSSTKRNEKNKKTKSKKGWR